MRGAVGVVTLVLAGLGAGFGLHAWLQPAHVQRQAAGTVVPPAAATGVVAQPSAAAMPVSPSTPVPAKSADILEQRLQATQSLLLARPASTVSIQLMGTEQPDQLRQQLKSLASMLELDNLYVYRTRSNGRPSMTVLYGAYPEREAANKALQALPKILRANQPQLRTVGGVVEEIKQLQ